MKISLQATDSVPGAAIMVSIIILLSLYSTIGLLASASRMLFVLSRPWSSWLRTRVEVDSKGCDTIIMSRNDKCIAASAKTDSCKCCIRCNCNQCTHWPNQPRLSNRIQRSPLIDNQRPMFFIPHRMCLTTLASHQRLNKASAEQHERMSTSHR